MPDSSWALHRIIEQLNNLSLMRELSENENQNYRLTPMHLGGFILSSFYSQFPIWTEHQSNR